MDDTFIWISGGSDKWVETSDTSSRMSILSIFTIHIRVTISDALDWDICLDIIAEYRVGPRVFQLLRTYWDRLTMVARDSRYFCLYFKGYHGVTQGDPLPPTLFNVVVDTVIRHWVTVVAATEEGT